MPWSANSDDRNGGRRKRSRRGPRWVTDHAREIAEQAPRTERPLHQPSPREFREDRSRRPFDRPEPADGRRWAPRAERFADEPYDRGSGHRDADRGYRARDTHRDDDRRYDDRPYQRRYDHDDHDLNDRRQDRRRDDRRYPVRDRYPDRGRYDDRDNHDRERHTDRHTDRRYDDDHRYADGRRHTDNRHTDNRRDDDRHHDRHAGRYDDARYDDDHYDDPATEQDADTGPRKLTVVRVAAWRSRQLTQQGIAAFRRATTADGADRSGLTGLTYPTMLNYGADAAIAVALANTLFFSAATAESKTKVALYLLITVAPFALIAPVIGPLLDRLQRGRRFALAASFAGRAVLAVVMAQHFDDWLLYPAALGAMVLSRSFNVLKAAVTPRLLPPEITLTKTNSRLAVFGLAAGAVIGGIAAGFAALLGSGGALWFTAVVCLVGAWLCLRIPAWVEVTEGEVQASLRTRRDDDQTDSAGRRRREPLGRHVVVALWGNGTIRVLTGFLTLFVAFVVKAQTEQSAWQQLLLLGMVGTAAGVGSIAGNAIGARQHFNKPDQVILTCVGVVLGVSVLAALIDGIATAVVVALVGSVCSALAKVCQDATIQSDMSEESRASAFGRTETILQLSWTFGGALGVLLPPTYWLGFAVVSLVLALGTVQTVMAHRGTSLIPRFGGDRPIRPAFLRRTTVSPGRTTVSPDAGPRRPTPAPPPETFGPETVGPETVGPEAVGPERERR